jgi:hypothetical protein
MLIVLRLGLPISERSPGRVVKFTGVSSRKSGRDTVWLKAARTFMSSSGEYTRLAPGNGSTLLMLLLTGPWPRRKPSVAMCEYSSGRRR